jgi:hypothetical protein
MNINNKITFKNQQKIYSIYRFNGYFLPLIQAISLDESDPNSDVEYVDVTQYTNIVSDRQITNTTPSPTLIFINYSDINNNIINSINTDTIIEEISFKGTNPFIDLNGEEL